MNYVYIASPYTLGDKVDNVKRALAFAELILAEGDVPFCPLLYHYWDWYYPKDHDVWLNLAMEWVRKCNVVVRLPGESIGADAEVDLARKLGIPVIFATDNWSPNHAD